MDRDSLEMRRGDSERGEAVTENPLTVSNNEMMNSFSNGQTQQKNQNESSVSSVF
jgi:hypothetical protein